MSGTGTGTYTGATGAGSRITGFGSGTGTPVAPTIPAQPAVDGIFGRAMRDIFTSQIGVDATFHSAAGSVIPCRVIINRSVIMQPQGMEAQVYERGITIEVIVADVGAVPRRGEQFIVGAETFTVQALDSNDGIVATMVVT